MTHFSHENAVVIIPTEEIWEPIQNIRCKHDRAFWRWMPHITLLYPFRKIGEHARLKQHFEQQLFSFPIFEIHLRRVSYFMHKNSSFTIWLQPEPSRAVTQLQAEIQQIVPDCNAVHQYPGGYHPHMTIASGRGVGQFQELLKKIKTNWHPLSFQVSCLYFLNRQQYPDDRFIVSEVIKFQ